MEKGKKTEITIIDINGNKKTIVIKEGTDGKVKEYLLGESIINNINIKN